MSRGEDTAKSAGPRPHYAAALDGLRALCVLGVFFYHLNITWCTGGLLGVTVLFVLSGYLVTSGLFSEYARRGGRIDLRDFWMRRVRRLMPTLVVFVVVCAATLTLVNHVLLTKMRPDIVPGLFMFINWAKIVRNESYFAAAGSPSPLTHLWSLAIEAQFYLVWPPILYFCLRRRVPRKGLAIGIAAASAISAVLLVLFYVPGADPSRAYYGTDSRVFSLLLGCLLAVAFPFDRLVATNATNLPLPRRLGLEGGAVAALAVLVWMFTTTNGYTPTYYRGGLLLCSIVAMGAIFTLTPASSWVGRLMSFLPLRWIGQRSYAIYLWHFPVLELLFPANNTSAPSLVRIALALAITFALSELSYRFVEQPLRKRGGLTATFKAFRQNRQVALGCAVVLLVAVAGCIFVPNQSAAGKKPDDLRVSQATLKKPLTDGVYDVVIIGDSVSLTARAEVNAAFPHGLLDSAIGRQGAEAQAIYEGYAAQGVVGDTVIFSIGTNGYLTEEMLESLIAAVGEEKQIWFVNNRAPDSWIDANNQTLQATVNKHDNVGLIDWFAASEGHDDYFEADGTHPVQLGREAYANLLVSTIGYEVPTEQNTTYDVTFIGDGVPMTAADMLASAFPMGAIDCADGREMCDVAKAINSYADQEVLGPNIVVAVGSGGMFSKSDVERAVDAAGDTRQLWFVNVRVPETWDEANNSVLDEVASKHDNVHVIDWFAASDGHDNYLASDGVNLTKKKGASAYVELISSALATPAEEESAAA